MARRASSTVATETARAVLKLLDFENMSPRLWGMMWGAEDLAASLGASRNRTGGRYHGPFLLARDLCLISAAAAGVVAIDTIATDINDLDALREEAIAARQDGFLAKAVIHPKHVDVVNAAFMPTDEEIAWSEKVVKAFNDNPTSGVVKIDGKMIDKPHLRAAEKILALRDVGIISLRGRIEIGTVRFNQRAFDLKPGNFLFRKSGLAQDLLAVLPEPRRMEPDRRRRLAPGRSGASDA